MTQPNPCKTADPSSYFSRMLSGEVSRPGVSELLSSQITAVDAEAGTINVTYRANNEFLNPAGTVQGGILSAMLDDLTASLVDSTVGGGQGVATLNLNVSFLRPAVVDLPLVGQATILRRGRDVCHVTGTLLQSGKEVASALAVCKIVTF